MILKLGMKHQGEELYKFYINHDTGMTLTYFTARSTQVAHAFEWGKLLIPLSYTFFLQADEENFVRKKSLTFGAELLFLPNFRPENSFYA